MRFAHPIGEILFLTHTDDRFHLFTEQAVDPMPTTRGPITHSRPLSEDRTFKLEAYFFLPAAG